MKKLLCIVAVMLFLSSASYAYAGTIGDEPGTPGKWFKGEEPAQKDESKPPLVFVHGINSSSSTWFDRNDMAKQAVLNGYESAFIDLYPDQDIKNNGKLLAEKLKEIYDFFGRKLIVIGHSKGGVDAQSALVYYNAHPYVEKVITLGSPHYGTPLADLAYSKGGSWLAQILGQKSDALYSLQTGLMAAFRSETDRLETFPNKYITYSGSEWGTFGGVLYLGGMYLKSFGANDGAVTVSSTRLSYANNILTGKWDHFSIKNGTSMFPVFQNQLLASTANAENEDEDESKQELVSADLNTDVYVKGGESEKDKTEAFYVEEGTNGLSIQWLNETQEAQPEIVAPNGDVLTKLTTAEASFPYEGAYSHHVQINKPVPGKWTIRSNSEKKAPYLLLVSFDSPLNEEIKAAASKSGDASTHSSSRIKRLSKTVETTYFNDAQKDHPLKTSSSSAVQLKKEGAYSVTVHYTGLTASGTSAFNRTVIRTLYVDHQGNIHGDVPY
ncbi:alpha/beta hydrolase [Bacillus sp. 28A-2]|uniref:esterase/lipase family protein n=1 Tax=Bacillus sp. 28A-2 TaxID=2772252 RepID=UPI00168CF409|nr:alpha/beta hydrolase [Bacillus sp. 28A-2]MBD3860885.1 alpha/beta hydrolase [Bacillus sp. 28A-2]